MPRQTERDELLRRVGEAHEKVLEPELGAIPGAEDEEDDFEPAPLGSYGEEKDAPDPAPAPETVDDPPPLQAEQDEPQGQEPEPEPEPEPAPEPEPEPEPPAEEILVVDQTERRVARDEVLEMGRSIVGAEADEATALNIGRRVMQRELAAENRLQDSAKLRSELREMRADLNRRLEEAQKEKEPPAPTVDEMEVQLDQLEDRIADADFDERGPLRTERARLRKELVRATVREERAASEQDTQRQRFEQAQESLKTELSKVHENWQEVVQDARFQEWLDTNRGGMYRQVLGGIRTTDGMNVPQTSVDPNWIIPIFDEWKNSQQSVSEDVLDRGRRKASADTPPEAATHAVRRKPAEEPENDGDYVKSLEQRRRRGGYQTGADIS